MDPQRLDFQLPNATRNASSSSPISGLEPKHIVRLFSRMAHLYSHRWSSSYGLPLDERGAMTPSAKQWLHDLRGYSPEEIAVGVQACVDKRVEWPPGPIEFANLCDGIPTVAEVLDRGQDYGPVCAAIRARLDWWNIESMPSAKVPEAVKLGMERAVVALRRNGDMIGMRRSVAIAHAQREAIS